jgi:hypothetical protein
LLSLFCTGIFIRYFARVFLSAILHGYFYPYFAQVFLPYFAQVYNESRLDVLEGGRELVIRDSVANLAEIFPPQ